MGSINRKPPQINRMNKLIIAFLQPTIRPIKYEIHSLRFTSRWSVRFTLLFGREVSIFTIFYSVIFLSMSLRI